MLVGILQTVPEGAAHAAGPAVQDVPLSFDELMSEWKFKDAHEGAEGGGASDLLGTIIEATAHSHYQTLV